VSFVPNSYSLSCYVNNAFGAIYTQTCPPNQGFCKITQTGKLYQFTCESLCTASSSIKCCTTDNCNSVTLKPIIKGCYSGGTYVYLNQKVTQTPTTRTICNSPYNQYCETKKGKDNQLNINVNAVLCTDICVPNNDNGVKTTCCQSDYCNRTSKLTNSNVIIMIIFCFFLKFML
jgi:hypothetical protein